MTGCCDEELLFAVGNSVDWEVERILVHLSECDRCRSKLSELAIVADVMREEGAIRNGFTDQVMGALKTPILLPETAGTPQGHPTPQGPSTELLPRGLRTSLPVNLTTLLPVSTSAIAAGAAAVFAVVSVSSPTNPIALGPTLMTGMIVCLGAGLWTALTARAQGASL